MGELERPEQSGRLQVKVPQTGVRVLIASDGVWDAFEKMLRVCRMARAWPIDVRGPSEKQIAPPYTLQCLRATCMAQLTQQLSVQWAGPQKRLKRCFRVVLHWQRLVLAERGMCAQDLLQDLLQLAKAVVRGLVGASR